MPGDAASSFNSQAEAYDGLRRRLIPPFETFYRTAVEALELASHPPRRILDLGAGTGLYSSFVRESYPDVELVLLDGAPAMLELAKSAISEPATFFVADLNDLLPDGKFDAVISALAIHHLEDVDKRALFARVHDALEHGGLFINAEQVSGPSEALDAHYGKWHRASSMKLGASADEWAAAEARMAFDHCSTVGEQLTWLKEAGFSEVDCLFKHYGFAVLFARRADAAGA
jgi:tRNA (cmo5U34)-methyltransferase